VGRLLDLVHEGLGVVRARDGGRADRHHEHVCLDRDVVDQGRIVQVADPRDQAGLARRARFPAADRDDGVTPAQRFIPDRTTRVSSPPKIAIVAMFSPVLSSYLWPPGTARPGILFPEIMHPTTRSAEPS